MQSADAWIVRIEVLGFVMTILEYQQTPLAVDRGMLPGEMLLRYFLLEEYSFSYGHTILQIPTFIICFATITNIPIGVAKMAAQTTKLIISITVPTEIATAPTKAFS